MLFPHNTFFVFTYCLEKTELMQILDAIISLIKEIADLFESDIEAILKKKHQRQQKIQQANKHRGNS